MIVSTVALFLYRFIFSAYASVREKRLCTRTKAGERAGERVVGEGGSEG